MKTNTYCNTYMSAGRYSSADRINNRTEPKVMRIRPSKAGASTQDDNLVRLRSLILGGKR